MPEVSRSQVLAYRVHVQQLDRPAPDGDPAVLDLEALDRIADTARDVVRRPMAMGEVSSERLASFRGAELAGFVP